MSRITAAIHNIVEKTNGKSELLSWFLLLAFINLTFFLNVQLMIVVVPILQAVLFTQIPLNALRFFDSLKRKLRRETELYFVKTCCLTFILWIVSSDAQFFLSTDFTDYLYACGGIGVVCLLLFVRHTAIRYGLNDVKADVELVISCYVILFIVVFIKDILFSSCFHLKDNMIHTLNSPQPIEHYFRIVEGIKTESNGSINIVEDHVFNRSHSALYTWYAKDENVGHVSLQLAIDDTYLSHWPFEESQSQLKDIVRGVQRSLRYDISQQWSLPDHVILFEPCALNQDKILEWHRSNGGNDDTSYHLLVENCISYVETALTIGGAIEPELLSFDKFFFLNSEPSTFEFTENVIFLRFYSSGYIWLDNLLLLLRNIENVMIVGIVVFCIVIVIKYYIRTLRVRRVCF